MTKRNLRSAILGLFVAVMLAVGLMPTIGLAQDETTAVSSGQVTTTSLAAEVQAYWTVGNMDAALPMPLPMVSGPSTTALTTGGPSGPKVVAPSSGPGVTSIPGTTMELGEGMLEPLAGTFPFSYTRYRLFPNTLAMYKTFPYLLTGKLFFTIPGQGNFVCSGSSVNSTNRSVVWTAGHCVYSPGVGFHTNFLFVPARFQTQNPYGTWTAKTAFTLNGWIRGFFEYDHGALVLNFGGNTSPTQKIGNRIGFLGFAANLSRGQHWHLHGYPAARQLPPSPGPTFDGEHHEICAASFATNDLPTGGPGDPPTIGVGCDMTGGTSGGPWVVNFSGFSGSTDLLNGNNSYRYTGPNPPENLKLFSPYFTTGAINLRNAAQAVPVP